MELKSGHDRADRPVLQPRWHINLHPRQIRQEDRSPAPYCPRSIPQHQVSRKGTQRDYRQVPR